MFVTRFTEPLTKGTARSLLHTVTTQLFTTHQFRIESQQVALNFYSTTIKSMRESLRMIYGPPSFEFTPSNINILKTLPYPHPKSTLFFNVLDPVVAAQPRSFVSSSAPKSGADSLGWLTNILRIFLGSKLLFCRWSLAASLVTHRRFLQTMCQKIAHVRAGDSNVTRWDGYGHYSDAARGNAEWPLFEGI